jgi:sulfur-oxidizing protein SoxY
VKEEGFLGNRDSCLRPLGSFRAVFLIGRRRIPSFGIAQLSVPRKSIKEIVGVDIFPHADVSIIAPEIAENGAVVPVGVEVVMPNISKIAILCEKNPHPLAALYDLSEGTVANIRTRIKMAETSRVVVIAKRGDKFYSADKLIKVTAGGCGG